MNALERWPWGARHAWLVGDVESISTAPTAGHPHSVSTTAVMFIEAASPSLGLPADAVASVPASAFWPALPLASIGSRIECRLGPWITSRTGTRFRQVRWHTLPWAIVI